MNVEKTTLWLATSSPELVSGPRWNLTAYSCVFIEVRTYSISPGHPLVSGQHLSCLPCVPHQDVSGDERRGGRCGGHMSHINLMSREIRASMERGGLPGTTHPADAAGSA